MQEVRPFLGYGLGFRPVYAEAVFQGEPAVDWFEILTENYLVPGGKPLQNLARLRERYPVVMHGVSLNIGSTDPLDSAYLDRVKRLAALCEPAWISDHLCFTGVGGTQMHDLFPLPYTDEAVRHVAARIARTQAHLGRRILIENVSSYVAYQHSTLSEWEFLHAIADEADCLLLLDINNIYVSAVNHAYDAMQFLAGVPAERVWQFHLAGHSQGRHGLIDTHDQPVAAPVWDLYEAAVRRFGPVSTLLERDDNFPPFAELEAELNRARVLASAQGAAAA